MPMTKDGYQKLLQELRVMKVDEMKDALNNLAEARDKGDITENAEYEAAKEYFENLQKKIFNLSEKLTNCVIVDKSSVNIGSVQLLTTVRLENLKTKKEQTFTIVPVTEIDTKVGKISFDSPVGKGLINRKVGEIVNIKVPAGELEFKILEISI